MTQPYPPGLADALAFPLLEALMGRRSRRFPLGASIPDGPFAYRSDQAPVPLCELEQTLLLSAMAGATGWHFLLPHHDHLAPHLPAYSASAVGRPFPSVAGFHTSDLFFTDDNGVYFFSTRDGLPSGRTEPGADDLDAFLQTHRRCVRKLDDRRLHLPPQAPYMEGHNAWCTNLPGSTLIIPVCDVAQHLLASLCMRVQNGACIYDDIHHEPIAGLDRFGHLVDLDRPAPLSLVEQSTLNECVAELTTCCYAGQLAQQAMGLGGWLLTGINRYAILGASGDPAVPGLGFRYDQDDRWSNPNPTGLEGVFEGHCPPHYDPMRAAVDALVERKFGPGGPFHAATPGPWSDSAAIRADAPAHDDEFRDCVACMAQHIFDRFGKFPGTVPTIFAFSYLQAHHLDLGFYDRHFKPGAYLTTHANHMARWHKK